MKNRMLYKNLRNTEIQKVVQVQIVFKLKSTVVLTIFDESIRQKFVLPYKRIEMGLGSFLKLCKIKHFQ